MTDPKSGKKWICDSCTYENWPASKKCVICRAPKPPQIINEEAPSVEKDIYKIAPLVSPDSFSGSSPTGSRCITPTCSEQTSNKWACQMCTYLNWPKANKCTQCLTPRRKAIPIITPSTTQPLSINVNIAETLTSTSSSGSRRGSPRNSPNSPEAAKALNNDKNKAMATASKCTKWTCKACTYENWPKAHKCTLCGVSRGKSTFDLSPTEGQPRSLESPDNRKRRSPSGSHHRSMENIEIQHLVGATASPSIYNQERQSHERHKTEEKKLRLIRNRLRDLDWLWLNACQAVVDGDTHALESFLAAGGDPARFLTADECTVLNRPSAFEAGYTLVHLAIRFQREDMLAALLTTTEMVSKARKRVPSYAAPDVAADILREISQTMRLRKGDFPCYFFTDIATFYLPADIEDLPNPAKKQLFDEILDKDAQKELEEDEPVINWSIEITERLGSRLYALWNRTAGDCLLDSVLQASWGVMDRDNTLRRALSDSLTEGALTFCPRWKESEALQAQSLQFSLEETQWQQDWAILLSLASQPGSSLEQIHIFALSHILRRPIIVYGIKFVKSFRGENIGLARFQGVYLPLLWERSFCWQTPIALGYTRGHFSALVPLEVDIYENMGAGANIDTQEDVQIAYLPLMDSEGQILPIHFQPPTEPGRDETILREWMDCCVTDGGLLVAQQKLTKPPVLVRQMLDEWLDCYRRLVIPPTAPPVSPTTNEQSQLSSDEETDDE